MAMAPPSSLLTSLTGVWSLLALRSDVDDIILELLGRFDLEKIYADSSKETYADLILALLAQLDVIFFIQRLTLPAPGRSPAGWSLGFLVSWEVTVRTVEFILQVVLEAREVLWDVSFRDEYLARLLLSTVRILLLHPKPPANSKAKDRRDRFARIQRSLERICDGYPETKSSLLSICRAIADTLCSAPDGLNLPPRLKQELPSLTEDLYPLPDCLSPSSIESMVPQGGSSQTWLSQLLALYDVAQFMVGANVQFAVNNRKTSNAKLDAASKQTRDAVLLAINRIRSPPYLPPAKLVPVISESFRMILPDTPSLLQHGSSSHDHDANITDAWDTLHQKLSYRQMVHRISDRAVMHSVYQITRYIELLDDPSDQLKSTGPRLYVVNCQQCHLIGYSQVKDVVNMKPFLDDAGNVPEINLPPESVCTLCGSKVTMLRELPLARYTWENLKSVIPNVEAVNVERHLPTQFLLSPPRADQPRRNSEGHQGGLTSPTPFSLPQRRWNGLRTDSFGNISPPFADRKMSDTPPTRTPRAITGEPPFSADDVGDDFSRIDSIEQSSKGVTFTSQSLSSSSGARTLSPTGRSDKSSSGWKSRFTMARKETKDLADTSSLSSATLESQKLEEIDLRGLVNRAKDSSKRKFAQNINVSLSQDSTYAMFWTHSSIQVWDVSTCPSSFKHSISTEGFCVLAAITGEYLAYMIGDRDQRLTLRIKCISRMSSAGVEYRMRPSPWCRCMTISPTGGFIAVGFENATVGLYNSFESQSPRQHRLHARHHQDCRDCPPVDTMSFSNDGLVLVASTRSTKNGTIQVYLSRFPFSEFEELPSCRYRVPLHESEDNGVSSVHFQPGTDGREDLVCITTWTQSGVPVLIQPNGGHKTEIRSQTSSSNRLGKLGHRIQASAFAPSGRELALVNDQGYVYRVSDLSSIPMDIRRVATSKALPMKSDSFALAFVPLLDEETILLLWSDSSKAVGFVKKIPVVPTGDIYHSPKSSNFVDVPVHPRPMHSELPEREREREFKDPVSSRVFQKPPVELEASEIVPASIKRSSKTGFLGSFYSKK